MYNVKKGGKAKFNKPARDFEQEVLGRFRHLRPRQNPPWTISKSRSQAIETLIKKLRIPSCWAPVRNIFTDLGFMKTSELHLLAGQVGGYLLKLFDIDDSYRDLFIQLFNVIEMCMLKVSTPGSRQQTQRTLPAILARLEILMPLSWNTSVIHILAYHTVQKLRLAGPYKSTNMLDIERFHTSVKNLARGKKDPEESIIRHYALSLSSTTNRLTTSMEWTNSPRFSTPAGQEQALDSSDKLDRMTRPLGVLKEHNFNCEDFKLIQQLWASQYPVYFDLITRFKRFNRRLALRNQLADVSAWRHDSISDNEKLWMEMSRTYTKFRRVEYAGNIFRVEDSQGHLKRTNDAAIRWDYCADNSGRSDRIISAYGVIKHLFEHKPIDSERPRVIAHVTWLHNKHKCALTGIQTVSTEPLDKEDALNAFVFLDNCYQQPVALWPHDPLNMLPSLPDGHEYVYYDVIDRNQLQQFD